MASMWLGVAIVYVAGFRFAVASGVLAAPAWTNVPGKAVRAGVVWVSTSVDMWGYRGRRRMGRVVEYRGRHQFRRFEGTYSSSTKRGRSFAKRKQTGV